MDRRHHTGLWLFAFLAFVVGDSVTTAMGVSGSAVESNPIAAVVLERAGWVGMVLLKSGIVIGLYLLYWAFDRTTRYNIDDEAAIFVAAIGLVVTAWNAAIVLAG